MCYTQYLNVMENYIVRKPFMWRARFVWRANRSVDVLPFPCAAPDFVISYFISFYAPLSFLWTFAFASTEVYNCLFCPSCILCRREFAKFENCSFVK